jgi:hypothetical protein
MTNSTTNAARRPSAINFKLAAEVQAAGGSHGYGPRSQSKLRACRIVAKWEAAQKAASK